MLSQQGKEEEDLMTSHQSAGAPLYFCIGMWEKCRIACVHSPYTSRTMTVVIQLQKAYIGLFMTEETFIIRIAVFRGYRDPLLVIICLMKEFHVPLKRRYAV